MLSDRSVTQEAQSLSATAPDGTQGTLEEKAAHFLQALNKGGHDAAALRPETIQALFAQAVRLYVDTLRDRAQRGEEPFPPYSESAAVTPTDVAIVTTQLLEAADMDTFELEFWRAFGRHG